MKKTSMKAISISMCSPSPALSQQLAESSTRLLSIKTVCGI